MIRTFESLKLSVLGAAACIVLASCAQQPTAPVASGTTAPPPAQASSGGGAAAAPAADAVDPEVLKALDKMAAYLRTLQSFQLDTYSLTDDTLDNGQLAQLGRTARLKVRRPDGLQVDMHNDRGDRNILYYNGKTASIYSPRTKYYATVQAPPTLKEVVTVLNDTYDIDVPAADLFWWDSGKMDPSAIKSASYLGVSAVDGDLTDQFALRQDDVDWQIWIQRGSTPLPRKLSIVTTSDPARPQHTVVMRWKTGASFPAGDFDFKAPSGSHRIAIKKSDGTVENPGK
ncbi:DUF2092 domain-containing protein [Variovorax sp. dw_954]|uniref:DUF2092 domain-containing protein n=1 Tax=Variovorax sp. dw_954 TaxID=2720078 RepID=UPI001BD52E44|nr:DUF2092 domain-containing protein [Variovorax sp. dw_954]